MNHRREDVLAMARSLFPDREPEAMRVLDRYGLESSEPERERVQFAILKLSEGDRSKLQHYLEAAKQDYRDVPLNQTNLNVVMILLVSRELVLRPRRSAYSQNLFKPTRRTQHFATPGIQ